MAVKYNFSVYSKSDCPYCSLAKALLDERKIVYQDYTVGSNITKQDVENLYQLFEIPRPYTVPLITVNFYPSSHKPGTLHEDDTVHVYPNKVDAETLNNLSKNVQIPTVVAIGGYTDLCALLPVLEIK